VRGNRGNSGRGVLSAENRGGQSKNNSKQGVGLGKLPPREKKTQRVRCVPEKKRYSRVHRKRLVGSELQKGLAEEPWLKKGRIYFRSSNGIHPEERREKGKKNSPKQKALTRKKFLTPLWTLEGRVSKRGGGKRGKKGEIRGTCRLGNLGRKAGIRPNKGIESREKSTRGESDQPTGCVTKRQTSGGVTGKGNAKEKQKKKLKEKRDIIARVTTLQKTTSTVSGRK